MTMAQISFQGRIIGQPELKFSQAGKPLLRFRTVENSRRQIDGEWKDVGAAWRDVTVFGKQAEHLAEHLADKQIVAISGRLDAREWEKQDGTKQTSFEVLADVVGIIPARQQAPTQSGGFGAPAQSATPAPDPWGAQNGGFPEKAPF